MTFKATDIEGVYILEPNVHGDSRGYFFESFRREHFVKQGIDSGFVQDNCSMSRKDTIRGLHYQAGTAPQAKLVMVSRGRILDVAADLRRKSAHFGRSLSVELSEENHRLLYIPEGFAHGFSVLSDEAVVHYKCSDYYDPDSECGIRWDDPDLAIDWKVDHPVLSEKDRNLPYFQELKPEALF